MRKKKYCYEPHPIEGGRESVSVRCNRREQLNEYWRNQRTSIRQARVRSELRLVGPEVFLSNPQLLRQVKSWIARKILSETGVADPHIDSIIVNTC